MLLLNRNCLQQLHQHTLLHLQGSKHILDTGDDHTQLLRLDLLIFALLQLQLGRNEETLNVLLPGNERIYRIRK